MLKRLLASMAIAGLVASPALAQEQFKFSLNWFPVGDHAAYWVALDKGYFSDAGLDVTLENSKGSGDSIAKVDTVLKDVQGVTSNAREATENLGDLRADVESSLLKIDALITELNRKWPFAPKQKEVKLP